MTNIFIEQLAVGPMANFAYLLGCAKTRECAVIDPGWDSNKIIEAAKKEDYKITEILLTHAHFDHAQDIGNLAEKTGSNIFVHASEVSELPSGLKISATNDGYKISLGNLEIACLHTPGHTPGSQCFLVNDALFTGDTLFVDGCGRVDLPGSDPRAMIRSMARIAKLDPNITIYPGHDYGPKPTATIGEQLKTNPYLNATSEMMLL